MIKIVDEVGSPFFFEGGEAYECLRNHYDCPWDFNCSYFLWSIDSADLS